MKTASLTLFAGTCVCALLGLGGAGLCTGCSKAQSQTVSASGVTNLAKQNLPTATAQSTNKAMDPFKKPSAEELKKTLTRAQFEVTQNAATEPPFHNEFWD